jgi:hypothetical protein
LRWPRSFGVPLGRFALDADRQIGDASHLGIGKAAALRDVIGDHRRRIGAPEQRFADRQCRHAEYTARNRFVGVSPQRRLDFRRLDACRRVGHVNFGHQLGPFDRQVADPAVTPDKTEDAPDDVRVGISRDGESQQGKRVERMHRRKLERHADALRLPGDELIGKAPLGGDFGRPLVSVRLEQAGEQHRPVAHADRALELRQLLALQVRER